MFLDKWPASLKVAEELVIPPMEVDTKADLMEWLRLRVEWFETNADVNEGLIGGWSYWNEARSHLLGLGLIDALDALGSEPPHISCVEPEINRKICDLVKGKLQSLLSHLTGDPTPPGGVDPEYRTKPLTAAIVKYYMTGEGKKKKRGNPSLWLKRKLKNKTFRGCVSSGNKYILDYRDFQEDAWEHIVTPETWERIRPESPVR